MLMPIRQGLAGWLDGFVHGRCRMDRNNNIDGGFGELSCPQEEIMQGHA